MPDPRKFLPLKDLVFRILVVLAESEQHGAALVQALADADDGVRVLPGHLYRTLDRMLEDGLIDEHARPSTAPQRQSAPGSPPSRFFRLTPLGRGVAAAETRRLEALVARSRAARLLKGR